MAVVVVTATTDTVWVAYEATVEPSVVEVPPVLRVSLKDALLVPPVMAVPSEAVTDTVRS